MRIFVVGTILVLVLCFLAVTTRRKEEAVSNVLFGFSAIVTAMMIAAFFEWI
jgi:chromate transport protein ChrA